MIGNEGQEGQLKAQAAELKKAMSDMQKAMSNSFKQLDKIIATIPADQRAGLASLSSRIKSATAKHDTAAIQKLMSEIPKIIQDAISGNRS